MSATVTVRFLPRAWIENHAVEADPEGSTTFAVPATDAKDAEDNWLPNHDAASDGLRQHDNAPEWIRNWNGPFDIEIEHDTLQEERP
jgi:hypothetical protein